jgi:hypothetical protein
MRQHRQADKTVVQILVQELAEGQQLLFGEGIHPPDWRLGAVLKFNLQVIEGALKRLTC